MKRILIASTRESAGKTSLILGIASALEKQCGYIKPFGDRLIYQRKKNWDYDSSVIIRLWGLQQEPESITLGFNHSKLRYVYNEDSLKKIIPEMVSGAEKEKDLLFIEGGKDLAYGSSIFLDSLSLAGYAKAETVIVTGGDNDQILDDISHIEHHINSSSLKIAGIIINKVHDIDDFKNSCMPDIEKTGIPVLGIIPFQESLTHYSVKFLGDNLFARVIAGEKGLGNVVEHVFVGAMSTEESERTPLFNKENKVVITSGDRSDMILNALRGNTAGIVLSNNIVPPSSIITKASEADIPLLLVPNDTYQVAKQIDRLEALITPEDSGKIKLLAELAKKHISIERLV